MYRRKLFGILITVVILTPCTTAQTIPSDREGLEKGEGLGMASYAEMNGYPGPKHVLELKDSLRLSPDQIATVQNLFNEMRQEALTLGKVIIAAEEDLNVAFRAGGLSEDSLFVKADQIARLRGKLRAVHLRAHLRTKGILAHGQISEYMRLRGYSKHAHH